MSLYLKNINHRQTGMVKLGYINNYIYFTQRNFQNI